MRMFLSALKRWIDTRGAWGSIDTRYFQSGLFARPSTAVGLPFRHELAEVVRAALGERGLSALGPQDRGRRDEQEIIGKGDGGEGEGRGQAQGGEAGTGEVEEARHGQGVVTDATMGEE